MSCLVVVDRQPQLPQIIPALRAASRALCTAGNIRAIKTAMTDIVTRSSISVNPVCLFGSIVAAPDVLAVGGLMAQTGTETSKGQRFVQVFPKASKKKRKKIKRTVIVMRSSTGR